MSAVKDYDIVVVGAGVLGVSIAYWLSTIYDARLVVADTSGKVASHASSRNTGVIHRPFYLDPAKKKAFAKAAQLSYGLWKSLASTFGLPWQNTGTLDVANSPEGVRTLEKYSKWGRANGMEETELSLIDGPAVRALEPDVECVAAINSKTDAAVDFGAFTRTLFGLCRGNGVALSSGTTLTSVKKRSDGRLALTFRASDGSLTGVVCRFLINAGGAGALRIAHSMDLAQDFSILYFRGDYWRVSEPFSHRFKRNIYTPPRHPGFPFLDPHLVVKVDGSRQVGPNAVLTSGPYVYRGSGLRSALSLVERPVGPKLRLGLNHEFISLLAGEWRSSISKRSMAARIRKFIPSLNSGLLGARGLSGVRGSVVSRGGFEPEAIILKEEGSCHILNYNSPGATGAPSYSAAVVTSLRQGGYLGGIAERATPRGHEVWSLDAASAGLVL